MTLLGGFEVRVDDEPVPASAWNNGRPGPRKLLALAPGHRLPRDRVLDELWPQLGAGAAMANLHKAAHHGRRALGHPGGVVLQGGLVLLAPEAGSRRRRTVRGDVDPDLYAGELSRTMRMPLGGGGRRSLRARYLEGLRAPGAGRRWQRRSPPMSKPSAPVMRARFAAGDRPGAVRAFERLSAALGALGLGPSAETRPSTPVIVRRSRIRQGARGRRAGARGARWPSGRIFSPRGRTS